jgi:tetratricopeptide (TPR) repeat protein
VQESGAVAEATRSENAALQDALALAERAEQERAIAAEALQAEVATLRETLAQAEREAQERAAAAAALEAEIVGLQGTLTAARQVGKAAIAASRIETPAPAKRDKPHGWRQAVMRLIHPEPSVIISRADRARDAGQWDFAAQLYREALDRNPRNPPIWVQYGHVLKESGDLREPDKLAQAEIAYRRALSLDPGVADSHLQLGHVLKLQGKIHEAEACYLRAHARDPSMPDPLRELSGLDWSEAQLSELRSCAVMSFSDREELTPNNNRRSGPMRRPQMSE